MFSIRSLVVIRSLARKMKSIRDIPPGTRCRAVCCRTPRPSSSRTWRGLAQWFTIFWLIHTIKKFYLNLPFSILESFSQYNLYRMFDENVSKLFFEIQNWNGTAQVGDKYEFCFPNKQTTVASLSVRGRWWSLCSSSLLVSLLTIFLSKSEVKCFQKGK